jgi:hypothetical protein
VDAKVLAFLARRPWQAEWITTGADLKWHVSWFADPLTHAHALARFRRSFVLDVEPDQLFLRLSADTRYRLWINGALSARGPLEVGGSYGDRCSPAWWHHDCLDVSRRLRRGANWIEAEVIGGPEAPADFSMGMCGLILELWDAAGGAVILATDRNWEVSSHSDGWRGSGHWHSAALRRALGSWSPARVLGRPAGQPWNLLANPLPPLAEALVLPTDIVVPFDEHRQRVRSSECLRVEGEGAMEIEPGAALTFYALFDRTWAGHLQLIADGPAGTTINISCQEIPGSDEHDRMRQEVVLDGERLAFESPRYFSARCLRVRVDIPDGARPLRLFRMAMNARTMPAEHRGWFESSDPQLDQLWSTCRWTEQLCRQGIHLDSPHHQEPLGDHGDYLVEAEIDAYAFGEHLLTRADLARTALYMSQHDTAMFHTSYRLLWIWMLHGYWMWTGDAGTVAQSLPQVRRLLEVFRSYVGPEGLVSQAPNYMFIDWVAHGGFNLHHPPACIGMGSMTSFYIEALRRAAKLEEAAGEAARAREHQQAAERTVTAFRRVLWSKSSGRFVDGLPGLSRVEAGRWLPADPQTPLPGTVHVNALAVLAGVAPPDSGARIMRSCLADAAVPTPQPYFMHFVFEALERAGCYDLLAPALLRRWRRMLRQNPSSLREMWDRGDYSHAWSGTPLIQCSRRILGVRPTVAGCREVEIRPHPCGLAFARGTVPTPLGDVSVCWQVSGRQLRLAYSAPRAIAVVPEVRHLKDNYDVCVESVHSV